MYRIALLLLVVVTACSSGDGPPRDVENACAIKRDRPQWFAAMQRTEAAWGIPVAVQLSTIYQESTFRPNARTPRRYFLGFIPNGRISSAYGYAQAIDGTWDWYRKETGRRFARRNNFSDATDFMGWYMHKSFAENGIAKTDAYSQYLAYHDGHAGYRRGSYRQKGWLLSTARKVDQRAQRYNTQLQSCF